MGVKIETEVEKRNLRRNSELANCACPIVLICALMLLFLDKAVCNSAIKQNSNYKKYNNMKECATFHFRLLLDILSV